MKTGRFSGCARVANAIVLAFCLVSTAQAQESMQTGSPSLVVSCGDGRMTIIADSVALRTVVQEWARVGGVRLVNPQHVSLEPVSILLQNVPEGEALKILLRSLPGYVLQKRSIEPGGPSVFRQLAVMAPAVGATQTPARSLGGLPAQPEVLDEEPTEAPYDPSSPPAGMAPAADGAFAQPQDPAATRARTAPSAPSVMQGQARPGLPVPLRLAPARNASSERQ